MSLQEFINSLVRQHSTMWSDSPMTQSLPDLPSSKTFAEITNKQCVKLAMGVAIVVAVIVIWDEYPNIKHAIRPEKFSLYGKESFLVGAMLLLYTFWFSIIGISALANSLFKLNTLVRLGTAASLRGYEGEEESKRRSKIVIRMFVTTIMMLALLPAIWSGIKLTIRPINESGLYALTISVGVAIAVFGLIYFIIGVLIMAELVGVLVRSPPPQTKSKNKLNNEVHSPQHSGPEVAAIV